MMTRQVSDVKYMKTRSIWQKNHPIPKYSLDLCIYGCKVHHGTSPRAYTYVRQKQHTFCSF
jgi:hypothetical protein